MGKMAGPVSRAQRSVERLKHGMVRCRPGTAAKTEPGTVRDQQSAAPQRDQRSRKVRATWSCSGLSRYCSGVRSWVWMKASTGMPGTRRMSLRRATSAAGSVMRTV